MLMFCCLCFSFYLPPLFPSALSYIYLPFSNGGNMSGFWKWARKEMSYLRYQRVVKERFNIEVAYLKSVSNKVYMFVYKGKQYADESCK